MDFADELPQAPQQRRLLAQRAPCRLKQGELVLTFTVQGMKSQRVQPYIHTYITYIHTYIHTYIFILIRSDGVCSRRTPSKMNSHCISLQVAVAQKSIDVVCAHQTGVGCNQQTEKLSHPHNKIKDGTWTMPENARQAKDALYSVIGDQSTRPPDNVRSTYRTQDVQDLPHGLHTCMHAYIHTYIYIYMQ